MRTNKPLADPRLIDAANEIGRRLSRALVLCPESGRYIRQSIGRDSLLRLSRIHAEQFAHEGRSHAGGFDGVDDVGIGNTSPGKLSKMHIDLRPFVMISNSTRCLRLCRLPLDNFSIIQRAAR